MIFLCCCHYEMNHTLYSTKHLKKIKIKIKIPSWCPHTLQERKVHSKPSGGNKALWHSARILQNKVKPDSSRSHYGISSVVNQINGCLWCWRVALRWPLQMHSLICHIFLSTLQFDKQDLNWSLPHSQQSTVNSQLQVAEGDIYRSMRLPPHAIWNGSCHKSLLLLLPPQKCHGRWTTLSLFVWKLELTASGDWAQTWKSHRGRCGSLGHVSCYFLLQTLGEAVVEEEELPVRKQAAEQSVDTVAPQQDLEGKCC